MVSANTSRVFSSGHTSDEVEETFPQSSWEEITLTRRFLHGAHSFQDFLYSRRYMVLELLFNLRQ